MPFSPDPVDDGTTAGAVAVPGDYVETPVSLDVADTTVTIEELPPLGAKWQKRENVRFGGVVPVALCGGRDLRLSFLGPVSPESDYPSQLHRIAVLPTSESAEGGNCFSPLWQEQKTHRSRGPIHVAIRVRPDYKAPESERRQVVLYNSPARADIVLIATKLPDEATWTPLLRVDMPKATRFSVMDPGWH